MMVLGGGVICGNVAGPLPLWLDDGYLLRLV
jgi:hypothetical protein